MDEGVGVGRASVEKVSSSMINEVADRCENSTLRGVTSRKNVILNSDVG